MCIKLHMIDIKNIYVDTWSYLSDDHRLAAQIFNYLFLILFWYMTLHTIRSVLGSREKKDRKSFSDELKATVKKYIDEEER